MVRRSADESVNLMNVQSRAGLVPGSATPAPTLMEQVLERLRDDIVRGKLAPSEKLRVQELGRRYGVGASPLREALSRLTADGLVIAESNRGFRVAPVSTDDFMDVVANRRRLESIALEQSVRAGDDAWEGRVVAAYHQLQKLEATYKPDSKLNDSGWEWEKRHRVFHHSLISACPSRWLLHLNGLLVGQFDRYRRFVTLDAKTTRRSRQQEAALLNATLSRDARKAVQILQAHIDDSSALIVRQLRNVL